MQSAVTTECHILRIQKRINLLQVFLENIAAKAFVTTNPVEIKKIRVYAKLAKTLL